MIKKVTLVLWIVIALLTLGLIGLNVYNLYLAKTEKVVHPEISFEIENHGTIKMELYPEYAPNTVSNIIKLAEKGYYNDKVIYGKDEFCLYVGRNSEGEAENPKASLINDKIESGSESDYEYTIPGEFLVNGFEYNELRHQKGVVSLMRSEYSQYFSELADESYNSGNAQMGIMMKDTPSLNGAYAAFGKITEGLDILEKIYNTEKIKVAEPTEEGGEVTEEPLKVFEAYPVIKSATVNTFGNDYGMPYTMEAFNYDEYVNQFFTTYYSSQE